MKKLFIFLLIPFLTCQSNDVVIPDTLEVAIGEIFEVVPGSKVIVAEIGAEIHFISFTDYTFGGSIPPNTTVTCELFYNNSQKTFKMYVSEGALYSDSANPVDPDPTDNSYTHSAPIGNYFLTIKSLTWEDPDSKTLVVKKAQFIME